MNAAKPSIAWPGWAHLGYGALLTAINFLWFMLVYGTCDWLTHARALRLRLDFRWEQHVPFVPAAALVYLSIPGLFMLAPFVLRTPGELRRAARGMALIILLAGLGFLLVPADLNYLPAPTAGFWQPVYSLADRVNLEHNLAPSLHVALSVFAVLALAAKVPPLGKYLLLAWGLAISLSTLLIHQHHVIDVLTGFMLATATYLAMYAPMHRALGVARVSL